MPAEVASSEPLSSVNMSAAAAGPTAVAEAVEAGREAEVGGWAADAEDRRFQLWDL